MKNKLFWTAIYIWMLILTTSAYAEVEVLGGGLTYHLIDNGAAQSFSHKLSNDGRLIANPSYGLTIYGHQDIFFKAVTVFAGENSVGSGMAGAMYSEGVEVGHAEVGLALGGYAQDSKSFTDLGIHSFRLTSIKGLDLVPLVGVVLNYRVPLSDKVYIKLNNLISPVITNTSLSLGYNF